MVCESGQTRTGAVQRKLGGGQGEKHASILAEELFFTSNVSWSVHWESRVRQSLEICFLSACGAEQVQGSRRGICWGFLALSVRLGWGKLGGRWSCVWDFPACPLDSLQFASGRIVERAILVVLHVSWDGQGRPLSWVSAGCSSRGGPRAGSFQPSPGLAPAADDSKQG